MSNLSNKSASVMLGMFREPRRMGKNNGMLSNFCKVKAFAKFLKNLQQRVRKEQVGSECDPLTQRNANLLWRL